MVSSRSSPFGKRYQFIEPIGSGGVGKVYKVFDTVRNIHVALKELSANHEVSNETMLWFKNEFRVMSSLKHPNLVEVYDFGITPENVPFITMELVSGKKLSECRAPSVDTAKKVIHGLCRVLSYIHSKLYIHRDLKPDNILLVNGRLKLLDFGLMTQLGVRTGGKISGTHHYLAPEIIVGGIIDESTDLYALGVIGYLFLTGNHPFRGTREDILQGHLSVTPPSPIDLYPDIPEPLSHLVMKLIAKKKENRYRNCAEVLEELRYFVDDPGPDGLSAPDYGYLYSSKLIGRNDEIDRFTDYLGRIRKKETAAFFIGAPAGMGKTRLLFELRTLTELENIPSIWIDASAVGDRIYGWVHELVRQLHLLLGIGLTEADVQPMEESESELTIARKILHHLQSAHPEAPFVVFIDDAHHMDPKSIIVLNQLIRNKPKTGCLIIAGFRVDEVNKTSALWHTVDERVCEYVELEPLNPDQIRELVENVLYPSHPSDDFIDYCYKNSGGNSFDLMELLKYMISEKILVKTDPGWQEPVNIHEWILPEAMEKRLISRIEKLDEHAKALAQTAAVLGEPLYMEGWQSISRFDEATFFQAIDRLVENQIIIKVDEQYQFTHDKIRQAFYQNLDDDRKMLLHRRTARYLEHGQTAPDAEDIAAVAKHFVIGKDPVNAIRYSLRAAEIAERKKAEWKVFDHFRDAVFFLESIESYPDRERILLEIYDKTAQMTSAAWIDAATCLKWMEKAIAVHTVHKDDEKAFSISLSYIVTAAISGNYRLARKMIALLDSTDSVPEGSVGWAVLYGAGVCLVDWYQGFQNDCYRHAATAIDIFESHLDTLSGDTWPAYSWALFWREKARAYLGKPIEMTNIEKNRHLMLEGKSDPVIYWHTLTAVGARAAYSGRWKDLLDWKETASQLSKEMGKIYWFECWISHSYLYGAIHHGRFQQLENHIERVHASPDPYQRRLAYLFRGMLDLSGQHYSAAEQNLLQFVEMEKEGPDNSYLEGFVQMGRLYIDSGEYRKALEWIEKGLQLSAEGPFENPLYQLQFLKLMAEYALFENDIPAAEKYLHRSAEIANQLDNPIQKGFIHGVWGRLYHLRQEPNSAKERYIEAKALFLSVGNKYQAGRVVALLEELDQKTSTAPDDRAAEPLTTAEEDTLTDEEEMDTLTDKAPLGKTKHTIKHSLSDEDTETDGEGLDHTEPEL